MKKAKIFLTAITVLAVVGGALAFKAKTFDAQIFCTNNLADDCNVVLLDRTLAVQPEQIPTQSICTDAAHSTAPCTTVDIYQLQ